jgi:alanine racemase
MGVVKADAYGHGMIEVARILANGGARWLAVSTVSEGIALREAQIAVDILVMAGLLPAERSAAVAYDLTPVAHSMEDIRGFDEAAGIAGKRLRFHLKLDTGMARLGTRATPADIAEVLGSLRHSECEGLLSHFASAADFTTPQTDQQIARFNELTAALRELGVRPRYLHFASTNAIAYARPNAWQAIVRPGHAIYGYVSPAKGHAPPSSLSVEPALSWRAKIVAVKDIPANTLVGYGGSACTRRPTRMAILGAGYADGIPHRLSNRGKVIAGGRFVPVLGTVSMDLTTIDITDSPHLKPGDDVTLIGSEGSVSQNAQEIARVAGTISYNVLCGIKPRVQRVYID